MLTLMKTWRRQESSEAMQRGGKLRSRKMEKICGLLSSNMERPKLCIL